MWTFCGPAVSHALLLQPVLAMLFPTLSEGFRRPSSIERLIELSLEKVQNQSKTSWHIEFAVLSTVALLRSR